MKEEFLHYLWLHRLYEADKLFDTRGNLITVIHPGTYNRDSGPDFFNARIVSEGITWAGNIEIHTRASHFTAHGHHEDPAYNNIILHVVAENDREVLNGRGEEIPTALIRFDGSLYEKYRYLVNNPRLIACQDAIASVDRVLVSHWLGSLAVERLLGKHSHVLSVFRATGNDWDETFYRMLSRYFGFRVNTAPFEMLAAAIPFRIIRKHADDRFRIEALLFGTAGLLAGELFREAVNDEYYRDLAREYSVLKSKYCLKPLHGWIWKFSRLRPANFPTIRISQLAALLSVTGGLFSRIIETPCAEKLSELLSAEASAYWSEHYVFGKKCRRSARHTGAQARLLLLINAVIPVVFVYGRERDRNDICERALHLLETSEAETNSVTREWQSAGIKADSALQSQALLQLRNEYCRKRRCLECSIGNRIISSGRNLSDHADLILEPETGRL